MEGKRVFKKIVQNIQNVFHASKHWFTVIAIVLFIEKKCETVLLSIVLQFAFLSNLRIQINFGADA